MAFFQVDSAVPFWPWSDYASQHGWIEIFGLKAWDVEIDTAKEFKFRSGVPPWGLLHVTLRPVTEFTLAGPGPAKLPGGEVASIEVRDSAGRVVMEVSGLAGLSVEALASDPRVLLAGNDFLVGSGGVDWIAGGPGDDRIEGGGGGDILFGDLDAAQHVGGGDDVLYGGDGDDRLYGGGGRDSLYGGDGHDRLQALGTGAKLSGGDGDDELAAGADAVVYGGSGGDRASAGANSRLYGEGGGDYLVVGDGSVADGGDDVDYIYAIVNSRTTTLLYGGNGDDVITGARTPDALGDLVHDEIYGGEGNDTLWAGFGRQMLSGGGGDDYIGFERGDQVAHGGSGHDMFEIRNYGDFKYEVYGEGGDDYVKIHFLRGDFLDGGEGQDVLRVIGSVNTYNGFDGGSYAATFDLSAQTVSANGSITTYRNFEAVWGGFGNDTFLGSAGNDIMVGGAGVDFFVPGDGDDIIIGEALGEEPGTLFDPPTRVGLGWFASVQYVSYADAAGSIDVNLSIGVKTGAGGRDLLYQISGIIGSDYDDAITGYVLGGEVLRGGAGDDVIHAGDSGVGPVRLGDSLFGEDGDDRITGGGWHDALWGGSGDDVLAGGAGDDVLVGGLGVDVLNGGAGMDTASFEDAEAGMTVSFAPGGVRPAAFSEDTYIDIEAFRFTRFRDSVTGGEGSDRLELGASDDFAAGQGGDDVLRGDDGNDALFGNAGSDNIGGGSGDDYIDGQEDGDFLLGGAGNDRIVGGAGVDLLGGEDGDDVLSGGADGDNLFGGGGFDVIAGDEGDDFIDGGDAGDYLTGGLGNDRVNGGAGADFLAGEDGDDQLNGGADGDNLFGGAGTDTLIGEAGNDYLAGEAGNDVIIAGAGSDQLNGGAGADRFLFFTGDSVLGSSDRVQDFQVGIDKIDLSFMDANTTVAGKQDFTWAGLTNAPTGAGTVRLGFIEGVGIFIFGYTDADDVADFILDVGTFAVSRNDLILGANGAPEAAPFGGSSDGWEMLGG